MRPASGAATTATVEADALVTPLLATAARFVRDEIVPHEAELLRGHGSASNRC
jgi:hypothetical protein